VLINGVEAPIVWRFDSEIIAIVPPNATTGPISSNPGGNRHKRGVVGDLSYGERFLPSQRYSGIK
jgi:hypothetical protein